MILFSRVTRKCKGYIPPCTSAMGWQMLTGIGGPHLAHVICLSFVARKGPRLLHPAGLANKVVGCPACLLLVAAVTEGVRVCRHRRKYIEAAEKFGSMKDRKESLLNTREDAYLGLLDVPHQGVSLTLHTHLLHWMHRAGLNAHSMRTWPSQTSLTGAEIQVWGRARPAVLVCFMPMMSCSCLPASNCLVHRLHSQESQS